MQRSDEQVKDMNEHEYVEHNPYTGPGCAICGRPGCVHDMARELRELRAQRIKDQVAFLQTDENIRKIQNSYERACGRIETLQTEARQRFEMEQQLRAQLAKAQERGDYWHGREEQAVIRVMALRAERDKLAGALKLALRRLPPCVGPHGPGSCRDGRDNELCANCDAINAARAALRELEAK
jgi:hypothetical protein